MGHSRAEVYLHFVWATQGRNPLIAGPLEDALHRVMAAEAQRLGCRVLATGGMPDHVHLLVSLPTNVSIARLVQQVKGVSSHMARDRVDGFYWQEGYSVFSVTRSHCVRVKRYVLNQKQHHTDGNLWADWEETEAVP